MSIEGKVLSELRALRKVLSEGGGRAAKACAKAGNIIDRIERYLNRPVRIAVLGEENSGKSVFLNYLLKHQILPSSPFPAEETEILIRYADEPGVYTVCKDGHRNRLTSRAFGALSKTEARPKPKSSSIIYQASRGISSNGIGTRARPSAMFSKPKKSRPPSRLIEVGLPIELLKSIEMIEVRSLPEDKTITPATIAFRQVDIAIWCTLATQAWKETESMSWRRIPLAHRKSSLMLVTYKDAIHDKRDEAKILERLRRTTPTMFNDILLVSLKDAVASLLPRDEDSANALRASSNIETMERTLLDLVREQEIRRARKASHLLCLISAMLARAENGDMNTEQQQHASVDKLNYVADRLLKVSPSVPLAFEAA